MRYPVKIDKKWGCRGLDVGPAGDVSKTGHYNHDKPVAYTRGRSA